MGEGLKFGVLNCGLGVVLTFGPCGAVVPEHEVGGGVVVSVGHLGVGEFRLALLGGVVYR